MVGIRLLVDLYLVSALCSEIMKELGILYLKYTKKDIIVFL